MGFASLGWLFSAAFVAIVGSIIVNRIYDLLTSGITSGFVGIARVGLTTVTWSAVTTLAGMHSFKKLVRQLRQGTARLGGLGE